MKKLAYLFTICSAMLIGCTDEKASNETDNAQQTPLTTEQQTVTQEKSSTSEQPSSTEESAKTDTADQVITPDQAEEVLQNIVETAQQDNVVKDVIIENQQDEITANITFDEKISDEERGTFLFNYMLFLEKQYPDQEVKVNIEE